MKNILLTLGLLALTVPAQAQRLIIGEKTPEIQIAQWVENRAASSGKATLIDFFHSGNQQSVNNLNKLDGLETAYGSRLNIVVISQETMEVFRPFIVDKGYGFYAGIDDNGKTFTAYGVRFVPFAALIDAKGRLVWTGNVAALTDEIIKKAL